MSDWSSDVGSSDLSRTYIPAVAKGIEEAMARGGVNGYPVIDVRAVLLDGKEHSVDSSEMAFRAAGRLAFREAMASADPVVLEPVAHVDVTVPAEVLGDVMGDLNRSEEHTSELQSLMRISYAVF